MSTKVIKYYQRFAIKVLMHLYIGFSSLLLAKIHSSSVKSSNNLIYTYMHNKYLAYANFHNGMQLRIGHMLAGYLTGLGIYYCKLLPLENKGDHNIFVK